MVRHRTADEDEVAGGERFDRITDESAAEAGFDPGKFAIRVDMVDSVQRRTGHLLHYERLSGAGQNFFKVEFHNKKVSYDDKKANEIPKT